MKKTLLTILCISPAFLFGQTQILADNFDSYTAGSTVVTESGGVWDTWTGGGGGAEDAEISSAFSNSGSNSMNVFSGGAANYLHDVVLEMPSLYTTGKYEFKMKAYVPAGDGGYFNLGSGWVSGGAGYEYGVDIFLNNDASGFVSASGTGVFTYSQDAWTDISVMVDLDAMMCEVFIDGNSVVNQAWGAAGGFGVADIFGFGYIDGSGTGGADGNGNMYVDDVEVLDWTGVGLEESQLAQLMNVVPNPTTGNFVLDYSGMNMNNATVELVDILGKKIFSENTNIVDNGSMSFDLNLRNGVYFLSVTDGGTKLTKKIIVKN